MSQIEEFRRIAIEHGRASFRDHIKNYFEKTGRIADEVGIRSLSARINKALRPKGSLHELAGDIIQPSESTRGKQAEWTLGHEAADDILGELIPVDSKELAPAIALLKEENKPQFLMQSSEVHLRTALARAAKGSRIAQRELGAGMMAQEYERRLRAMNEETERRERSQKDAVIEDQRRLIDFLTAGATARGTNGRAVITRRPRTSEDSPSLRDDVN
jgi:hypothetical protein